MDKHGAAIIVDGVSKSFRLPHERQSSLKSSFVNVFKGKRGYETQRVLQDISFEIKKGEFFGIVGKNGSGKSTLLKLLAGIYTPNQGKITVNGSLTPFIELGVGFNPELTGRENVFLNGALLGFSHTEMESMYDDIVAFAELERFMDQKLKNYSSGMQVRLAFSIAIKAQSDILLIDEVLAVGDARFQQKCFEYFYELKNSDRTVIFISHDMDAVQRFCDRAIYLKEGEIEKHGLTEEVADAYLQDAFETTESTADGSAKKIKTEHSANVLGIEVSPSRLTSKDTLAILFRYDLAKSLPIELRVALVKDGISFAHYNSRGLGLPNARGEHEATFTLPAECLMDGPYQVACGLFDAKTGEQYDFVTKAATFYVTDRDPTRYGLVRLQGSWNNVK